MLGDTVLIVNPKAGRGMSSRQLKEIKKEAKEILSVPQDCVLVTESSGPNSASAIASRVQKQGAKNILAAGGDGIGNQVVNGLVLPDESIAIGFVPLGTGNVVASHFSIPRRLKGALEVVKGGATKTMDICVLEGEGLPRYALFAASVGLDAVINEQAHCLKPRFQRWRLPTITAYFWPILGYSFKPVPLVEASIKADGRIVVDKKKLALAIVTNTPRYGGRMMICPWAKVDDGVLNLTLASPMKSYEVIRRAFQMWRGTHIYHTEVFLPGMSFKSLEIIGASLMPTQMDGEPMPPQTHIKVSVLAQALRVFVPNPKQPQPEDELSDRGFLFCRNHLETPLRNST